MVSIRGVAIRVFNIFRYGSNGSMHVSFRCVHNGNKYWTLLCFYHSLLMCVSLFDTMCVRLFDTIQFNKSNQNQINVSKVSYKLISIVYKTKRASHR